MAERKIEDSRKKKEQESAEAISGLIMVEIKTHSKWNVSC